MSRPAPTTNGGVASMRRLLGSAGRVGEPAKPDPAPEGDFRRPPVAGPDLRTRTAIHEAGHAAAQVHLRGPESVAAASIRRGKGHLGITLLASPAADRHERELGIVVTLAGDEAVLQFGLLEDGWHVPTPDEAASVAAVTTLDELSPLVRERLLEAEAEEADPALADAAVAERSAQVLSGWDYSVAGAHLRYLQVVASGFVRRHGTAIRRVAQALLERETLDGATVAQLVLGSRCVCHGWTAPPQEDDMRKPPAPPERWGDSQLQAAWLEADRRARAQEPEPPTRAERAGD